MIKHMRCATPLMLSLVLDASLSHGQAYKTRDSSGVTIVENPSRRTQPVTLVLESRPRLEVGGLEAVTANEFNSRTGTIRGVILSDGGIAVIDIDRIHYFDRTGKRVRIVGRQGKGPGEFVHSSSICRTRGDSIVVFDRSVARLSVLDGQGQFVRSIPLESPTDNPPYDGCFEDGTFIVGKGKLDPQTNRYTRVNITRLDLAGRLVSDMGTFERTLQTAHRWTFLGAGSRMYIGTSQTSEIKVYSQSGALTTIVRSDDPVQKMTDAEIDAVILRTIPTDVSSAERSARLSQQRSTMGRGTWPSYGQLGVDPDGRIWVADYAPTNTGPMGWSVFDGSGRLMGRLVIPRNLSESTFVEVLVFGRNEVLIRRTDSDGAKRLGVYRLGNASPNK